MAQNQARAGIFYLDFDYDKTTDTATKIKEIPSIDINMLRSNITGLEELIKNYA